MKLSRRNLFSACAGGVLAAPALSAATTFAPVEPIAELELYLKAMLRQIAVGAGVSYEQLAGDLSEVNFDRAFRRRVHATNPDGVDISWLE